MKSILLSLALIAGVSTAALAASQSGGISQQVKSFCSSGCDSSATTFVVPPGAFDITATYCGSGGAGAGGYNAAAGGGGGGGGSGVCWRNQSIDAMAGVTLNLVFGAGPSGGAINVAGLAGIASQISWTQGAITITTPVAMGGMGGGGATAANGGSGGAPYAEVNSTTLGGEPLAPVYTSGQTISTGGSGVGPSSGSATYNTGDIFFGSYGAAGGGATSGTGGPSRLVAGLNGATGDVLGGAATNTNTCGGGGAGGSSMLALGGVGGSASVGSVGAGFAAGGGGGSCNQAGGAGGAGLIILRWKQQ